MESDSARPVGGPPKHRLRLSPEGLALPRGHSDVSDVLTDKPNIVIAKPPRRIRRKPNAAALVRVVVDARKAPSPMTADEHEAARAAADRLWQEMKRRVAEQRRP